MSAQDNLNEEQFDHSELRAHVRMMHSVRSAQTQKLPRSNADLAKWHGRQHHLDASIFSPNHYHEEDNAGRLMGPNTDARRPSGWETGRGAVRIR